MARLSVVNYKDGRRTRAWIIQPLIKRRNEFTWDMLEPLDVSKLSVFKVVSKIPVIVKKAVEPVATYEATRCGGWRWVERVIESGLPDGHKHFILYVLSAYLANIKRLDVEEAIRVIESFLKNSCRNYNNCGKLYESFIRGDLRRVKSKELKPVSLNKLREKRPRTLQDNHDPHRPANVGVFSCKGA